MRRSAFAALTLAVLPSCRLAALQCPDGAPPPCRGARSAAAAPAPNSVAVLYFDNLSRDSNDLYLADGLTEEVITRLSGIERLSVRSRQMVRRFRGDAAQDPVAVGRALNVAYLVTGTVRRAGDRLRVSAELIRAAGGVQVWGRQFDQASGDVFAIQEAVSREVATGIVGRLVPAERQVIAARPTTSAAAYDAFLRGNFYLARRDSTGTVRALREYEAALRADPAFTDALSRIALTYGLAIGNAIGIGLPPDSVTALALRTAAEAVGRAPNSADAWMSMALARYAKEPRTLAGVREANARAVALDSNNAEAHHQLAFTLSLLGEDSAAVAHLRRALAIEPSRPITLLNLGQRALLAGRFDEARRWMDSALVVDPEFLAASVFRVVLLAQAGDRAGVRAELERWRASPVLRPFADPWMSVLAITRGDTAALRLDRQRTIEPIASIGTWPGDMSAQFRLLAADDREGALMLLERVRPVGAQLHYLLQGVVYDPIRADPRFQRLVRESSP